MVNRRKAMYAVKFYDRQSHALTDEQVVCFDASMAGFERAVAWGKDVADPHEYVGEISRQAVERP